MKTLRVSALALLVPLALASCMRMDLQMRMYSDDTVEISMVVAMAQEWADPDGTGANPLYDDLQTPEAQAEFAEIEEEHGIQYDFTEYREEGYVGVTMDLGRMSIDDAMNTEPATSVGLNPQEMASFGREGEYFVYVMPRESLSQNELFAEYDPSLLANALQYRVVITFPGAIVEHNAGKVVDGNAITFNFDDLFGPPGDIVVKAYAEDGRGLDEQGSTMTALVIVGIVLAAVAATIVIILRRRRGTPQG